ncbi:MAG: zinc ribbon domain-containing protein [Elusimicrobia bacterium]|nr:zinc ribbon domain-containing protein [Elusimicrobiota bacterium]
MPIHSFVCKDCKEEFDILVNVTADKDKPKCEKCGSSKITRIFSSFAVSGNSNKCDTKTCDVAHGTPGCCPGCKHR